ncbi:Tol-Pal system beta propeller repeat protein TolB [Saccharibacter floricola]|uniref:Tol-Pal system protein TolB n=1 Tax=Saccharibacter floricola DSM 15669 TaxID=1123227 RepID=A0ABQ0NWV4_9PROT|nr:Tol-Pal system beta propeller repeat protein TolB [Saccharibacter floricola]GBQ05366.1 translocation protein TolB [Saccharibacter floricola DSM 15669]
MSFFSNKEAEALKAHFSRRSLLGGLAAGGVIASPLRALAQGNSASSPEITVANAHQAPIPIIVPDFGPGVGQRIASVIAADLGNTGLFQILPGEVPPNVQPDFRALKARGARAAVAGTVVESGQLRVEMRLWDVLVGQQIQGTAYTAPVADWRRIAHIIADVIYQRLMGEEGYFDTRIAYVARTGPRRRQTTRLAIMDQDGMNPHMLTDGRWLTLEPRFSPVSEEIAFLSYAQDRPRVYTYDINSGRQRMLGAFEGISFAPRFAPHGKAIILSATTSDGGADLYQVDLASQQRRRLTSSPGVIDTSPCYSPDGQQIVFNSDRGGSPQLYVMSASGDGARRISYGAGRYGSPVWSPRGDVIAFTRIHQGRFSLGVMNPDGTGERILTEGFTVESPSFAPNGRALTFCRQSEAGAGGAGFTSTIGVIDVAGFNEHILPTATGASDPAWSPKRR